MCVLVMMHVQSTLCMSERLHAMCRAERSNLSPGDYANHALALSLKDAEECVARAASGFFAEASCALLDIAEGKLYMAANFTSFYAYVRGTPLLGFGYKLACMWVAAARFIRSLPPGVLHPHYERQVRPLVRCDPGIARAAWELALQRGSVRVSGRMVAECLAEVTSAGATRYEGTEDVDAAVAVVVVEAASEAAERFDRGHGVAGEGVRMSVQRPVFLQSNTAEWYTPTHILDLVREVFSPGGIDLDPCTTADANSRVRATCTFDVQTDGLADESKWAGNVFVNPPFGMRAGHSMQGLFFDRCAREYGNGSIQQAVLLLKVGVGYRWFETVLRWPVCFLHGRLAFVQPVTQVADAPAGELCWGARVQNPHGSIVVYMGPGVAKFARVFGRVGSVPGLNAWALAPEAGVAVDGGEVGV